MIIIDNDVWQKCKRISDQASEEGCDWCAGDLAKAKSELWKLSFRVSDAEALCIDIQMDARCGLTVLEAIENDYKRRLIHDYKLVNINPF